jgi:hypothetical protein
MAPADNIYDSRTDVVDGLDIVDMMEDDQYESVLYDDVDDGQPAMYDEMQDYYGGDDWDHGQYDMPEDWSI